MLPIRTINITRDVTPLREGGSLRAIVEAEDEGFPHVDLELMRANLATTPAVCRSGAEPGPIGRFRWLVSPRSTMIQTSPVHTGRTRDPAACLEHLMRTVVRRPE